MTAVVVFAYCVEAIRKNVLIQRVSKTDKEFHFQNWFKARLQELGQNFEIGGRNSYPDFRMVATTDGFELKGLAYPGRDASFDSNSQVPAGIHNGRSIYYVFGRYPKKPDGNSYPVLDLVLCHGSFLNADHEYVHENKSVKGFGSYGDILIRDRKMYVVPTPFRIADGMAHHQRLSCRPTSSQAIRSRRSATSPPRGDRVDRGIFLRPANKRASSQENSQSERRAGTHVPGVAVEGNLFGRCLDAHRPGRGGPDGSQRG